MFSSSFPLFLCDQLSKRLFRSEVTKVQSLVVSLHQDSKPLLKFSTYMYKKLYSERALITTFVDTKHFCCYETPCCFASHRATWTTQVSQTQLGVNRFFISFAFYFFELLVLLLTYCPLILTLLILTQVQQTKWVAHEWFTFCLFLILTQVQKATPVWAETWAEHLFAGAERLMEYQIDWHIAHWVAVRVLLVVFFLIVCCLLCDAEPFFQRRPWLCQRWNKHASLRPWSFPWGGRLV